MQNNFSKHNYLFQLLLLGFIYIPQFSSSQQPVYDSASIWRLTLSEFLNRPEKPHADILGGCVSITEGAVGTSVIVMALEVSKVHEKDSAIRKSQASRIDSLKANQEILMKLADQDRLLFAKFLKAYKMPGSNPIEKKARDSLIYCDLLVATQSPLQSSKILLNILEILNRSIPVCSTETISDAYACAYLVKGAFDACISIADDDIKNLLPEDKHKYDRLRNAYSAKSDALMNEIKAISRK